MFSPPAKEAVGDPTSPPLPLILGHRGASALELENTCPAFARAMRDGADGVELDVQCSSDGEVFVFHDETLSRLAGRPDRFVDLPSQAIRDLRLDGGYAIPTLAEVLETCGPEALVNVELKFAGWMGEDPRRLIEGVARVLQRAQAFSRAIVSSFSPRAVWEWRARYSQAAFLFERTRRGTAPWPLQPAWLVPLLNPFAVHPESPLCTPRSVTAWRRRGLRIHTWTVDDPAELRRVFSLGVDGIITNDPGRARKVLALTPRSTDA